MTPTQPQPRHAHSDGPPPSARLLAVPAALLSVVAPGLGHLLLGLRLRAVIWLVGYVAFALSAGMGRPAAMWTLSVVIALDAAIYALLEPGAIRVPGTRSAPTDEKEDGWKPLS